MKKPEQSFCPLLTLELKCGSASLQFRIPQQLSNPQNQGLVPAEHCTWSIYLHISYSFTHALVSRALSLQHASVIAFTFLYYRLTGVCQMPVYLSVNMGCRQCMCVYLLYTEYLSKCLLSAFT